MHPSVFSGWPPAPNTLQPSALERRLAVIPVKRPGPGDIQRKGGILTEDVTFNPNRVGNNRDDHVERLNAQLFMPDIRRASDTQSRTPAVVIVPSSAGIRDEREVHYARELAAAGIAALVIDSYGSRGMRNSIRDQSKLGSWEMGNDAIAGLRWLIADGRFDAGKIAVMGVSKGGTAAMHAAIEVRRRWTRSRDVAFAAHVAISPACTWIHRSHQTTGAPVLFLLAERDDQTPAKPCVDYAARLKAAGNTRISVKVYKDAHHAWDRIGEAPLYSRRAENYAACRIWVEDDGSMTAMDTNETVPEATWHEWAITKCITFGTTCCGGSTRIKQQATADIILFLRSQGFVSRVVAH